MQEYPVKRGLTKDLNLRIGVELKNIFGVEPGKTGDGYRISSGALLRLDVRIGAGGKTIIVDTESDINSTDEVILDTNKKFRKYLDVVTGFSTKERVKRSKGGAV